MNDKFKIEVGSKEHGDPIDKLLIQKVARDSRKWNDLLEIDIATGNT